MHFLDIVVNLALLESYNIQQLVNELIGHNLPPKNHELNVIPTHFPFLWYIFAEMSNSVEWQSGDISVLT